MGHSETHDPNIYYVPHGSRWPIIATLALFTTMIGAALTVNKVAVGHYVLYAGLAGVVLMLFGWFGDVIRESVKGFYNRQVDISFRMGMIWFIFSEVMFFAGFFGALFYIRNIAVPGLADADLIWPGYPGGWPTAGPGLKESFSPMPAWGIPALNTVILLSSGATVTWAHWGLLAGRRWQIKLGLALTILLGAIFLVLQAYEYIHAEFTIRTGVYGATFFMLTGFHGVHVTLGALMLVVILGRVFAGHFTPRQHFAFEAVSWYWHFVDVVWLLLFVFVYWL